MKTLTKFKNHLTNKGIQFNIEELNSINTLLPFSVYFCKKMKVAYFCQVRTEPKNYKKRIVNIYNLVFKSNKKNLTKSINNWFLSYGFTKFEGMACRNILKSKFDLGQACNDVFTFETNNEKGDAFAQFLTNMKNKGNNWLI